MISAYSPTGWYIWCFISHRGDFRHHHYSNCTPREVYFWLRTFDWTWVFKLKIGKGRSGSVKVIDLEDIFCRILDSLIICLWHSIKGDWILWLNLKKAYAGSLLSVFCEGNQSVICEDFFGHEKKSTSISITTLYFVGFRRNSGDNDVSYCSQHWTDSIEIVCNL